MNFNTVIAITLVYSRDSPVTVSSPLEKLIASRNMVTCWSGTTSPIRIFFFSFASVCSVLYITKSTAATTRPFAT